jgi:hypothetical protein
MLLPNFSARELWIPHGEVISIYCAIILSVSKYAHALRHSDLTAKQLKYIKPVQERCVHLLYHDLHYNDA